MDQLPHIMDLQDVTLARDLAQLVFRSALRRHGESAPIALWLLQPPNGVLAHLQEFFPGCKIHEIPDFPEACTEVTVSAKRYNGAPTHAAKLLDWLQNWDGDAVTPDNIRTQTNLTKDQFKEAKKHPAVRQYFQQYVISVGSGRHTVYQRKTENTTGLPA